MNHRQIWDRAGKLLQEGSLLSNGFNESYPRTWARDGEWDARETCSGSDVHHAPGGEPEAASDKKGLSKVSPYYGLWLSNGRQVKVPIPADQQVVVVREQPDLAGAEFHIQFLQEGLNEFVEGYRHGTIVGCYDHNTDP